MKSISIKWFAAYRDATGVGEEQVETTATTAADLFAEMKASHTGLSDYTRALVAINDEMVSWDTPLAGNDEVLFFPPVAGG